MENYLAFIMVVALAGILLDGFISRYPNMQRQLYKLFFAVVYILFVIRYYYGPDIWTYVPHYEEIASPATLWHHPDQMEFEWGYEMVCSLLHAIGVSYWGMTAIITTLFFVALACVFHPLPQYRTFALAGVVLMDYNLIFAENRQCLAVSFFLFMVLCLQKKQYWLALPFAILTILCHKSGFMPVGLTLMGMLLYRQRQSALVYNLLIGVLIVMMLIPVSRVATPILSLLPLPSSYIDSLSHHMQLGRQFQIIALIYLAVLVLISMHNSTRRASYTWLGIEVLIGMVIIVALYQYFFLLNRIRSYYTPLILFYLIRMATDEHQKNSFPYAALLRQSVAVLFFLYCTHGMIGYVRSARKLHAPITRASTLFDLRKQSPEQIRDKQMKIAQRYWTEDYMQRENNKL